jgi:phytoene/squalene synthetase
LHYFIGHDCPTPSCEERYLAASAAHITHMLRDTLEDSEAGFYNIPREVLDEYRITPQDVASEPYRMWVQSRVRLARAYFEAGRRYLSQVRNHRCRIVGHAYIARFEGLLDIIAREGYHLQRDYTEYRGLGTGTRVGRFFLSLPLLDRRHDRTPNTLPSQEETY